MSVVSDFKALLEKHGFETKSEQGSLIRVSKKNGAGFVLEVVDGVVKIYPDEEHKEAYRDIASEDITMLEEELSEISSVIADLKVIAINNSMRVDDRLRPYLEELLEEMREDAY